MKKIIFAVSSAILFLFILWGVITNNFLINILDKNVGSFIISLRNAPLNEIMIWITNTCGSIGSAIIFIIFASILFLKRKNIKLFVFSSAFFIAVISQKLIKDIVERERPLNDLIAETGFSFPSGHSIAAIIFIISSIILIAPTIKNKKIKNVFIIITSIVFSLVLLSRIYLSVHYPSDVLASIFLGIVIFITSEFVFTKMLRKEEKNVINNK